jgi:L-lysine exporter family protein LysE/ArgO
MHAQGANMNAFFYGAMVALGLIIPLGMQNIFIFNQGVTQQKWAHTLPAVLTAFVCDAILILCAVTGISLIVLSVPAIKNLIYFLGFIFLIYMGFVSWCLNNPALEDIEPLTPSKQMLFAASVSLLNPHAIIDSIAVIGTNSLSFMGTDKWIYTIACISVSLCWFTALSLSGYFLKRMDSNGKLLKWLGKLSSITIWCVALYIGKQLWDAVCA